MDKKTEILLSATEIISEEGLDALTMSTLSKKENLTKASLYHYFSSKEEILDSLFTLGHKNLMKKSFRLDLKGTPKEVLENACDKWEEIFLDEDNWHFLRSVFSLHFVFDRAREEYRSLYLMLSSQATVIVSSFLISEEKKRILIPLFSSFLMLNLERALEDEEINLTEAILSFLALID